MIGYSIMMKEQGGTLKLVWAAAEERQGDQIMEETNVIKLALLMAK